MVSVPPGKFEFLCVVHDKPGALEKRLAARPTHFANLQSLVSTGVIKVGGATLDEVPTADGPLKMNGSAVVLVASSVEEAREFLSKDIYATSGVWDVENAQILPFKCAVREP
ncbi:hypothetical protein BROUX41_000226 [Berkeleyomyces rouxiae]|uniref:uncharacterized protein n=1 Tax=Berkeleyomyces rouxiae TaxID=2035830 RepID=UPI003B790DC8